MQVLQVKSVEQFEKEKARLYFYLNLHLKSELLGTLHCVQPIFIGFIAVHYVSFSAGAYLLFFFFG